MGSSWDFIEWLGPDTSTSVLMLLDDPADLLRVSAVSRSWRRFVIANGFCKKLCIRMCPELSNFTRVVQISNSSESLVAGSSSAVEWESLDTEHRIYGQLSHHLVSHTARRDCFFESICASSTDNYPDESINNTLEPSDRVSMRPSYWSSKGEKDPEVPETLTYRLCSKFCIIEEIKVQPFRAYFQDGSPIYSAKVVRFRMGHPQESGKDATSDYAAGQESAFGKYIWTYVSPEFPMVQENVLQSFKLPRPVVCIGGILQIELFGRVQKQEMDGLYYICVCHAQGIGRTLSPVFDVDVSESSGDAVLNYFPDARGCASLPESGSSDDGGREPTGWHAFAERIRQLRAGRGWNHAIINTLLGGLPVVDLAEEEGSDEEL